MIRSFKHKGLEKFFLKGIKSGIQAKHAARLRIILGRLYAATNPKDMDLPGLKLHELSGRRRGVWSVWVSGNWRVTFRFEGMDAEPEKWWGPFPYKAFEVESNVYLASWFEKEDGDYVTLLINFNNNILYGSAIIAGKTVHFYGARIVKVNRK